MAKPGTKPKKPRPAKAALQLRVEPVTPDRWPALEDLFGERGACNGCWCMYWRIGAGYCKRPPELNRQDFRRVVKSGPPPGLMAFDEDMAVGWCQITPRDSLPWLDQTWRLRRVDELPVWAISCFYIRIGYRRMGITSALIRGAVEMARQAGGPGGGSLSPGRRHFAQPYQHRLSVDLRAGRIQGGCKARAGTADPAV